jgi:hypothetical protein
MPGSLTTPDRPGARNGASGRVAFRKMHCVGIQNRKLSRLNGWPMRPPVNASPRPSRAPAHDSGPMWIATPSSQGTCTLYSLPVSRRTQISSALPPIADLGSALALAAPRPSINNTRWTTGGRGVRVATVLLLETKFRLRMNWCAADPRNHVYRAARLASAGCCMR